MSPWRRSAIACLVCLAVLAVPPAAPTKSGKAGEDPIAHASGCPAPRPGWRCVRVNQSEMSVIKAADGSIVATLVFRSKNKSCLSRFRFGKNGEPQIYFINMARGAVPPSFSPPAGWRADPIVTPGQFFLSKVGRGRYGLVLPPGTPVTFRIQRVTSGGVSQYGSATRPVSAAMSADLTYNAGAIGKFGEGWKAKSPRKTWCQPRPTDGLGYFPL